MRKFRVRINLRYKLRTTYIVTIAIINFNYPQIYRVALLLISLSYIMLQIKSNARNTRKQTNLCTISGQN